MQYLSVILLGLAVSLDGFGVGLAYGARSMRIPFISTVIISFSSAMAILLSMLTGKMASSFFSPEGASVVGGIMLVVIGIWITYNAIFSFNRSIPQGEEIEGVKKDQCQGKAQGSQSRPFSFFSDILKDPHKADFDRSGEISGGEAVALGIALAMDAFGAGFGAAMMGFNPLITSVAVGFTKMIMLPAGFYLGNYYFARCFGSRVSYFSGFVLIILGLINLFNIM